MIKNVYAVYDTKVEGIPGDIFCDFNHGSVIRNFQEQQKNKPISKDVANDLVLICLGTIDFQSAYDKVEINTKNPSVGSVGKLSDFLSFTET